MAISPLTPSSDIRDKGLIGACGLRKPLVGSAANALADKSAREIAVLTVR